MMKINTIRNSLLLLLFVTICSNALYAQPIPPDPNLPVGGGVGVLLFSLTIYGIYKKIKSKK